MSAMEEARIDRKAIARALKDYAASAAVRPVLIGFDGYVDKLVKPRICQEADAYYTSVREFAMRLLDLGGTSSDIAVKPMFEKIGGNGPLLAEALAEKDAVCSCIGAMGIPELSAPYRPLSNKVRLYSVAECAGSYALEFPDGKIMLGDTESFNSIDWQTLQSRIGQEKLLMLFQEAQLLCFANWSGLPKATDLLQGILRDVCPALSCERTRSVLFDLADPTGKSDAQFVELFAALEALAPFYERIVGLNPKECLQVYNHYTHSEEREFSAEMLEELLQTFPADEIVIHDAGCAYVGRKGEPARKVTGRFLTNPRISVGAGDNFNSGYCLGKLCALPGEACAALGNEAAVGFMERERPMTRMELLEAFEEQETIA